MKCVHTFGTGRHKRQADIILLFQYMSVKLLNEHHLEFLSLKGGCTGSSESTLVKMPHCWKSRVAAQMDMIKFLRKVL